MLAERGAQGRTVIDAAGEVVEQLKRLAAVETLSL
jgi:hypothetical protein